MNKLKTTIALLTVLLIVPFTPTQLHGNMIGEDDVSMKKVAVSQNCDTQQSTPIVSENNEEVVVTVEETTENSDKYELSSRGASNSERVYLGEFELTAYCNCKICCGKWSGSPCANGQYPADGITIAVDKKVIPLGSKVYIDGFGERIAMDTGSQIKGNRIDMYISSHDKALQFGRKKNVSVYILK